MVATTLSPARALRPARRVDARAFLGLVIAAIATIGAIVFWVSTSDSRTVLVAARELPAGATLGATDLNVARVRVDDAIYRAAVPGEALNSLAGKQLAEPLHAYQIVTRAQLSARPPLAPDQMALTIPVSPATAVGGRLRPGDSVRVLVTTARGRPESRTTVVVPRVSVFDVGYDGGSAIINAAAGETASDGGSGTATRGARAAVAWVTLVVSDSQAGPTRSLDAECGWGSPERLGRGLTIAQDLALPAGLDRPHGCLRGTTEDLQHDEGEADERDLPDERLIAPALAGGQPRELLRSAENRFNHPITLRVKQQH